MKLQYVVEDQDIKAVYDLISRYKDHHFVIRRLERNIEGNIPPHDIEAMWQTHIMCLLTTQQKSGFGTPVDNFLNRKPFPLTYEVCKQEQKVREILSKSPFRREKIADAITQNIVTLEDIEDELLELTHQLVEQRKQSPHPEQYLLERKAAKFLKEHLHQIGPKQSRNFWQELGLMRYEFVLDSRALKWIKDNLEFPIPLAASLLSEEEYYCFISDLLRELCRKADVYPCLFDAAVFASFG